SSPARLADAERLAAFKHVFVRYGALPGHNPETECRPQQDDLFLVVPLVYGLLHREALSPANARRPLKPLIRAHLSALGARVDEEVVAILQYVIYHYTSTLGFPYRQRPRKMTIGDLRANRRMYNAIRARQFDRCALCGISFDGAAEETLDHVLPWR